MKKETKIKTWAFFMRLGNKCGCHQMEERSFKIKGYQFPVCSRCTGILTGQIIGIIIYLLKFRVPLYISIIFLLIMFIDWYIQYKKIKQIAKAKYGNLAGIAQTSILIELIIFICNIFK